MKIVNKIKQIEIKTIWSFLDQFSGVYATILILYGGIKYASGTLSLSSPLKIILFVFTIILFLFVGAIKAKSLADNIKRLNEERTIKKYIEQAQQTTGGDANFDFDKILPENNVVKIIAEKQDEIANDWSPDTKLVSTSLSFIKWDKVEIQLICYYWSKFKGNQLRISTDLDGKISTKVYDYRERTELEHIYSAFPDWKRATLIVYKYLEDRLSAKWDLSIYSYSEKLSITFSFTEGRIEKELGFTLKNNEIVDKETNKTIATM